NRGSIVAGAGIPVTFYDVDTKEEFPCVGGTAKTTHPLTPGQCEVVECSPSEEVLPDLNARACVDNEGFSCSASTNDKNNECHEDNNRDEVSAFFCPDPG